MSLFLFFMKIKTEALFGNVIYINLHCYGNSKCLYSLPKAPVYCTLAVIFINAIFLYKHLFTYSAL